MPTTYTPEGLKGAESAAGGPAAFNALAWARWVWRQLTSMRVALMLLLLLAVVALPGAFFPQRDADPAAVVQYYTDHPASAPWLERFHLFDVYGSPWFSAVYLLLFTSLIGCIVPRTYSMLRNLRAEPARVPRRFAHFDVHAERVVAGSPKQVAAKASGALGRRYRRRAGVEKSTTAQGGSRSTLTIAAERGYGREAGNLIFHLALVGLLIVTAWGQLVHYRGQVVLVEGHTFVNSAIDYDSFDSGPWFDPESLEPYRFRLDSFESEFTDDAQARDFRANVTVFDLEGRESAETIRVNHPLQVNGADVYLTGNGFAPDITVRDATGEVAFSGPVPFLPQNDTYTSRGVVMVPDANGGGPQIGLNGYFFPTANATDAGLPYSAYPQPLNPVLMLDVWFGNLGLDDGRPQNVYVLNTDNMELQTTTNDAGEEAPYQVILAPGETADLPDGQGTVTFNSLPRFVALDLKYDPSIRWMGVFAALAFAGLVASLFLPRRRVWLRLARGADGTTVVTAAALARGDDPGLQRELERVLAALGPRVKEKREQLDG